MKEILKEIKTKLKNLLKEIDEIGRESLTIMFVPHSERKILTLHLSYYTIAFIIFILIISITFASISLLSHSTSKQEFTNLVNKSKLWLQKEKMLREEIENLNSNLEKIKDRISDLYVISAGDSEIKLNLWAKGGVSSFASSNNEVRNLTDIYDLKQINNDLSLTYRYIEHIKNFIDERTKFFSQIPSIWPLKVGGYITSEYGWRRNPVYKRRMEFHRGIDIASWPSAPVVATADGTVISAGWMSGYGLTITIQHAYGFKTYYAHLSKIKVRVGKKVKKGEVIGYLGRTGFTTGYHLHYEVRVGIESVNPWEYIINIK